MSAFTIKCMVTGPLHTNAYLLWDNKSKEAALFDVGGDITPLIEIIKEKKLKLKYIFCTHGHFDHIIGLPAVKEQFPDAKIGINQKELDVIKNHGPIARMFRFDPESIKKPDLFIDDNNKFYLGELEITAILTPGHTPGSICYYFDNSLISGDLLFHHGVGRTDLYGGNFDELVRSIRKIYTLPDETVVYPGHQGITYIGTEKKENPVVKMEDFIYENFHWIIPRELAIVTSPSYQSEYLQLELKGVKALITLSTEFPDFKELQEAKITHVYLPIKDSASPCKDRLFLFFRYLDSFLPNKPVAVHGVESLEYSCIMVASYLILKGRSLKEVQEIFRNCKIRDLKKKQIEYLTKLENEITQIRSEYEKWKK